MESLSRIDFGVLPRIFFPEINVALGFSVTYLSCPGMGICEKQAYFECQNGLNYANTHNPLQGKQSKGKEGDREDYPCNLLTIENVSHDFSGTNYRYIILDQAFLFP